MLSGMIRIASGIITRLIRVFESWVSPLKVKAFCKLVTHLKLSESNPAVIVHLSLFGFSYFMPTHLELMKSS